MTPNNPVRYLVHTIIIPHPPAETPLQSAQAFVNLADHSIYSTQGNRLSSSQRVHGLEGNVEPLAGPIDSQHVDGATAPRGRPTSAAVGRVPTSHGLNASDVGEVREGALRGVALGLESVNAVRAGNRV